ncbi:small ribosomal subunit protein bS6m-like [Convolutriloba macropyga]|uniref:small ribosomal subunit protein bS6m-like n=1 Tax=Convolutriloba macropyga TaxID=536237 RepID=UPI003F527CBE
MPSYEALFAFKTASRLLGGVSLHDVIRRSVLSMMKQGAIVTHLKNMGELTLGQRMKKERTGHFFIVQCELPSHRLKSMEDELKNDKDILNVITTELEDVDTSATRQCTGSVSHLVLNPELHDYDWNYEGNLMRQVPREFERMNPHQTKSTLRGAGVNEIWGSD